MNPYLIIAAICIWLGTFAGGYLKGSADVKARWVAEVTASDLRLSEERRTIEKAVADKEAAQAAHTRNMEAEFNAKLQAADAGRDAFAKRLRDAQARYSRCQLSAASIDPSSVTGGSTGGDAGPRGPDLESLHRLRSVGLKLQETVKLCVAWAAANGR